MVPTQVGMMATYGPFKGEQAFVALANIPDGQITFHDDVKFAAFVLLHELGHRRGAYGKKDDHDGISDKNGTSNEKSARNNKKVIDACFAKEVVK